MMCSSLDALDQLQQAASDLSAACRARLGISETVTPLFTLFDGVIHVPVPNVIDALIGKPGEFK